MAQWVKPFHTFGLLLYPHKASENQMFLGGIEKEQWHKMALGVLLGVWK